MTYASNTKSAEQVAKYADMFSAMGTEPRLRIMQLLLSAHPDGLVVGEIQAELDIPNSTLSHHLDKLKNEDLVRVRRESTFLRYTANTEALQELLQFLYAECCTRNKAVKPKTSFNCANRRISMNSGMKEVVKEKYGEAALRVTSRRKRLLRSGSGAGLELRSHHLESLRRFSGRVKFPRRPCLLRLDAAIRPRSSN